MLSTVLPPYKANFAVTRSFSNLCIFVQLRYGNTMYDMTIRNGTVVTSDTHMQADVGIRDGTIVALGEPQSLEEGEREIDATNRYLFPGFIDSHTHVKIPLGEFITNDGFEAVTRAAAFGGTTTIVDFAIPDPEESPLEAFRRKRNDADENAYVNYGLHACITDVTSDTHKEIAELIQRGASSVKMFMVYEGRLRLTHGDIRAVMETVAAENGLALIHAEDQTIINQEIDEHQEVGETDYTNHPATHPNVSETTAMWVVSELVADTECPTYFVHVSTAQAERVLEAARREDLPLRAETCPHYLTLTEEVYQRDDGENYVCSPPVRDAASRDRLWELINEGLIQMVNSDHCGYDTQQKQKYQDDITRMPNGLPGVETRNTIMYSEGVATDRLSPSQFVSLTSTVTSKVLGLYPQKGTITVGADADIAIYDPETEWTLNTAELHMETDYSPYNGFTLKGRPETTIVGGEVVVDNNRLVGDLECGSFVPTDGSDAREKFQPNGLSATET